MAKRAPIDDDADPFLVELGERLTKLRLAAALHVDGLAYRSGLSPQNIVLIEAGNRNPSILTLRALAQGLQVDLYQLIPGDGDLGQAENASRGAKDSIERILELSEGLRVAISDLNHVLEGITSLDSLIRLAQPLDKMEDITLPPRSRRRKDSKS